MPDRGSTRGVELGVVMTTVVVMLDKVIRQVSSQTIMMYLKTFEPLVLLSDSASCFRFVKPTPRPTYSAIAKSTSTASAVATRAVRDFFDRA